MKFDSINDIEDYIRNIIGIPYVNLEGIDIEVCNELINTLEEAFSLYPLLKKSICAIGHQQSIANQMNLFSLSNKFAIDYENGWFFCKYYDDRYFTGYMSAAQLYDPDSQYIGFSINNSVKNKTLPELNYLRKKDADTGFSPNHCGSFRSMVWHEIGHIFDYILKITGKPEFLELIQSVNIEKQISKYATTDYKETFAEAFAEYHSTNEPNDVVRKIVEFGLEEYRRRAEKKSEIFDVSRKFR